MWEGLGADGWTVWVCNAQVSETTLGLVLGIFAVVFGYALGSDSRMM